MEAAEAANQRISKNYTKIRKLGEGTYAVVHQAKQISTGRQVAIKKIKVGQFKDGIDMSALREVKFLQELKHPNVIELLDVYSGTSNVSLVLELLATDLEALIRDRSLVFSASDVKSWMLMMMRGLEFCHRNWVLHRDLKPNNLFIAENGVLKIADFGLAREFADPGGKMTSQVVTRWYRPPELLFGSRYYGSTVDTWSAGCILAELMLRVPFMAGESDFEQISLIYKALGTPTQEDWPDHDKCSTFIPAPPTPRPNLSLLFSGATPDCVSLVDQLLTFNPSKRLTALQALQHHYFNSQPPPTPPHKLPKTLEKLKPRALGPIEGLDLQANAQGAAAQGRGVKRRGEEDFGEEAGLRVAKKLDYGGTL